MFVIADLEWITNSYGHCSPSQLAAVRVDENWYVVDEFDSFIRPRDKGFYNWKHIAYNGGSSMDFILAPSAYTVLENFQKWLNEDDVILWWYDDSEKLFKRLVELILHTAEPHKSVSIREHIRAFLYSHPCSRGSVYKLAESKGVITRSRLEHCSKNDVRVVRELLRKISYPQSDLLKPVVKPQKEKENFFLFIYDKDTNKIHSENCPLITGKNQIGYDDMKTPIKKGYKPCGCCKKEYNAALKIRNIDILDRSQYTYIYSPESKVFHKHTCGFMHSAKNIMGTRKYESVVKTGRTPCKVCNPTPFDKSKVLPPQYISNNVLEKEEKKPTPSKEALKALKRQRVALEERTRRLKEENLTETERNDVFTLTQPRFAFWVGRGCQTFHLHGCSKLHKVSELKGFGTYNEAVQAGYTPCRKCKPTSKHNANLSIPITNKVREKENPKDLVKSCYEAGYDYSIDGEYFYIETSVGKWRINTNTAPIKLEHINLVITPWIKDYHEQPRVFLSLTDVFDYIRRHDTALKEKKDEGRVFVKYVING